LVIKTLDPDRYSAYNVGSGFVSDEYGCETLISNAAFLTSRGIVVGYRTRKLSVWSDDTATANCSVLYVFHTTSYLGKCLGTISASALPHFSSSYIFICFGTVTTNNGDGPQRLFKNECCMNVSIVQKKNKCKWHTATKTFFLIIQAGSITV